MNIMHILGKDPNRKNLKNWFRYNFPNIRLTETPEIKVETNISQEQGLIGTAFDYLFRFNLERINRDNFVKENWVAETGLHYIFAWQDKYIDIGYKRDKRILTKALLDLLEQEYDKAESNYQTFITNGILTDDLIKSSIFLAKLDNKVRAGIVADNFESYSQLDVNGLRNLFDVVPWNNFQANHSCILNPKFKIGDGDLILDNTLIDFKVTKKLKIERIYLNQLISYYISSLSYDPKKYDIKEIGIYFARYGHLWKYPIGSYFSSDESKKRLQNEFHQLIKDKSLELVPAFINQSSSAISEFNKENPVCPYCKQQDLIKNGKTSAGKIRYRCKNKNCNKNFSSFVSISKETGPLTIDEVTFE